MARDEDKLVLVVRQVFRASAEFLFDAWTDPALMAKWFHGQPGGHSQVLEADVRVGGAWRIAMLTEDGTPCQPFGKYVVIERPRRLVFTWHPNEDQSYETTVTLTFKAIDADTTELVLAHSGLRDDADRARHGHGWDGCLANLLRLCEGRPRNEPRR